MNVLGFLRKLPTRRDLSFLGFWLLALAVLLLAFDFGSLPTETEEGTTGEEYDSDAGAAAERPTADTELAQTSPTEKRNVVLVHLESTRAQSLTPYNEDLNTTPFLDELAKESLLVEQAHVGSIPRSLMANISVNCGIQPPPRLGEEADPTGVPVPCLAGLLGSQGYSSAFFSSNADEYVKYATTSWGYEEAFAPPEPGVPAQYQDLSMDTERFTHTSFYGYEEDIMLEPSEKWLEERKGEPFVAEYLTNTGHDEYRCLDTRYGSENLSEDDLLNHYYNCLRLQDIFLQNLFEQYKELGLYEDTIFVLFGDHGEGFGEHGRFQHGDAIWEEGLKVPMMIHAPGWFEGGERFTGLSNQTDVLPTVLEMLGYEIEDEEYSGYSLLHPVPEDRALMFSCISRRECVASIKGNEKYVYHYDNQPEEVFDLSEDPLEENNLASLYSEEDLDRRRRDIFAWISRIDAGYYGQIAPPEISRSADPGRAAVKSRGQAQGSTVELGQPLTVGDAQWTVTSVSPADRLVSFVDGGAKRGNFVVVDFQLENNSNEGMTLSSEALSLLDGYGREIEFDTDTYLFIDRPKNLFRVEVSPGTSQEGQVIFKVPPEASQLRLRIGEATNPFSDSSGYVNLGS